MVVAQGVEALIYDHASVDGQHYLHIVEKWQAAGNLVGHPDVILIREGDQVCLAQGSGPQEIVAVAKLPGVLVDPHRERGGCRKGLQDRQGAIAGPVIGDDEFIGEDRLP